MKNFTLLRIATEEDLIEMLHETRFDCHEKCPDYKSGCLRTCTHDGGREYIKEWLHEESNPEREEEIMDRAINEIKSSGLYTERPRDLINEVINENKEKLIEEMKKEGKLVTGWIPVEERLPEEGITVWVTVKHSEWISDYGSEYIPREEWEYHPESNGAYKGKYEEGTWHFEDEENEWIRCEREPGETRDLGRIYDTVTAWMPLPEPCRTN